MIGLPGQIFKLASVDPDPNLTQVNFLKNLRDNIDYPMIRSMKLLRDISMNIGSPSNRYFGLE
jgi:hypothetical protein